MENCSGFCEGPRNTKKGLVAKLTQNAKDNFRDIFNCSEKKYYIGAGNYLCPMDFKCNPTTEEATKNVIKHGGRTTICFRNPWKWGN